MLGLRNSRPTAAHDLQPEGQDIDLAGCITGIVSDQHGVRRPQDDQCDGGAFEFGNLLTANDLPLIVDIR